MVAASCIGIAGTCIRGLIDPHPSVALRRRVTGDRHRPSAACNTGSGNMHRRTGDVLRVSVRCAPGMHACMNRRNAPRHRSDRARGRAGVGIAPSCSASCIRSPPKCTAVSLTCPRSNGNSPWQHRRPALASPAFRPVAPSVCPRRSRNAHELIAGSHLTTRPGAPPGPGTCTGGIGSLHRPTAE
jgi:hypothetical protein